MANCDLLGLLVTAQYPQVFFIYRSNCENIDMCEWCHSRWAKTEQTEREGE